MGEVSLAWNSIKFSSGVATSPAYRLNITQSPVRYTPINKLSQSAKFAHIIPRRPEHKKVFSLFFSGLSLLRYHIFLPPLHHCSSRCLVIFHSVPLSLSLPGPLLFYSLLHRAARALPGHLSCSGSCEDGNVCVPLRLRPAGSAFCWSVLCSRCRSGREGRDPSGWRRRRARAGGQTDGRTEIYVQISRIDECPAPSRSMRRRWNRGTGSGGEGRYGLGYQRRAPGDNERWEGRYFHGHAMVAHCKMSGRWVSP